MPNINQSSENPKNTSSAGDVFSTANAAHSTPKTTWKGIFWAARTRILLWYIAILAIIFVIFIPVFLQLLYTRVDARVRRDMTEKTEAFEALLAGKTATEKADDGEEEDDEVENQPIERPDTRLKPPETTQDLEEFFDAFLLRQLPEDEVYLLSFVNGKLYKSSPRARPEILARDSQLVRKWAKQVTPDRGETVINDPEIGTLLYIIRPVIVDDQPLGVFVVAHTTAGERGEVLDVIAVMIQLAGAMGIVALMLGWIASGYILAPLRSLSTTARSIGESDLTRRIPVRGQGEIAELTKTFNDMMDRLQFAFTSQRNFINDAGHELRTPITIIRGHLELMGDTPEEQQESIAVVMDELDRMSRFVDDLILLAKSEHLDFLQLETVNIAALTTELFTKAQALAERHWQLEGTSNCLVVIDRQRITQAVINLAQNATQHTQVNDTITIGSAIRQGKVHLWVKDTGEGISLSDQQRIFDRFARAAKSRRRSEGAGLGLSIVKAIAEAHGGEVTLRSQLGQGSTFAIVIPLEPPKELSARAI
jgi:signal transduction histidine kinase